MNLNPPRFTRCSQPLYLKHVGRDRVTQILLPFAPELSRHGIALPAAALPDDLFFHLLASLAQCAATFSPGLLDAMTAIEVIEEVFPDEMPAASGPLIVRELRLRLVSSARPILLSPVGTHGAMECELREVASGEGRVESGGAELREGVGTINSQLPTSDFQGKAVGEGVAQQLFALVRALELATKFRKAPVTRVFVLYCLDGKTRKGVARDCNCSPALITLRLKAIESKLGRKPAELRQYSDHFERIADSLSDPRARRIQPSNF